MVAAGLLDTSPHHAEAVTNMAFDMRQAASLVTTPRTSDSIKVRYTQTGTHVSDCSVQWKSLIRTHVGHESVLIKGVSSIQGSISTQVWSTPPLSLSPPFSV